MQPQFTLLKCSLGGLSVGIAAAAMIIVNGRVLGISGMARTFIKGHPSKWQAAFLCGMMCGAVFLYALLPSAFDDMPPTFTNRRATIAGTLVGVGASLGNGCTSGHGICGISRLSLRSTVYTITFMLSGMASAVMSNAAQTLNVEADQAVIQAPDPISLQGCLGFIGGATITIIGIAWAGGKAMAKWLECCSPAVDGIAGMVFAVGIGLAGMCPGPALIAVVHPSRQLIAFLLGMAGGFWGHELAERLASRLSTYAGANMKPAA
ncbi:probable UPF0394 membrane protein PD_1892 at N-terminal half [Coccomyxa sp. Obi]|nr:probable UPF0394 membrane protein PD_1892 at N-terminal half [Coccomyxa sp. Obi]